MANNGYTAQKLVSGQEGSNPRHGSRNFMDKVILKMDFEEETLILRGRCGGEASFIQEEGDSSLPLPPRESQFPNNTSNGEELHNPALLDTCPLCVLPHSTGFLKENPSAK